MRWPAWKRALCGAAARHPLASRASLALQELGDEPFLLLKEGHCFREKTIWACRRSRLTPNVIFESGQFATILAMVAAGMGISVVPCMARQKVEGCRFVRLEGERNQRKIGTVYLRSYFSSRAQQSFLDYPEAEGTGAALERRPIVQIGADRA